jgi:hypothetical protein
MLPVSSATFWHLPSTIVEALWTQPVLQVGKQVVVTRRKIRAVRRVVKQLPVKVLQQCSSASSCMRTCIFIWENFTECQHSTSLVLNDSTQFIVSQYICAHYCGPLLHEFTISTPFLFFPRKQLPSAFWQTNNICLKFSVCLVTVYAPIALAALWFQYS